MACAVHAPGPAVEPPVDPRPPPAALGNGESASATSEAEQPPPAHHAEPDPTLDAPLDATPDVKCRVSAERDDVPPRPRAKARIPPEVIQRPVRRRIGCIRRCYERGLVRDPNLSGRVAVRFVIATTGRVANVEIDQTEIHDPEVLSCIQLEVGELVFPAPEGGIVTVVYPFTFVPRR